MLAREIYEIAALRIAAMRRETNLMAAMQDITITEAKKLERGGLYVIEFPRKLSRRELQDTVESLAKFQETYGVKFLILDDGARLASRIAVEEERF